MIDFTAVVITTRPDDETRARELLCAAYTSGAKRTELWLFGSPEPWLFTLPVDSLIVSEDMGPLIADRSLALCGMIGLIGGGAKKPHLDKIESK